MKATQIWILFLTLSSLSNAESVKGPKHDALKGVVDCAVTNLGAASLPSNKDDYKFGEKRLAELVTAGATIFYQQANWENGEAPWPPGYRICITLQDHPEHGPGNVDDKPFSSDCKRRGEPSLSINMDGTRGKETMQQVWVHELVHLSQPSSIKDALDKQCWRNSQSGWAPGATPDASDPENYKKLHAELAAASAIDAEDAYNEFEAAMAELCALAKICPPKQGKKQAARQKLRKLCAKLDDRCKDFEEHKEAFDTSYDIISDIAGQGCRNEDGDLEVTISREKTDNEGNGTGVNVDIKVNMDQYSRDLADMQARKDGVNEPQEGETKSEKEKKKAEYKDLIDALGC